MGSQTEALSSLRMLHILLLLPSLAFAAQLPEHMLGQYQLETSEGFNNFMHEVGVSWFTRKIACGLYPKATIKNLGGNTVGIDTSSTFKSSSIEFELGVPFEEMTADGTNVETTATLTGDTLTKEQKALDSSGVSRIETRVFREDGKLMELIHTIPGQRSSPSGFTRRYLTSFS